MAGSRLGLAGARVFAEGGPWAPNRSVISQEAPRASGAKGFMGPPHPQEPQDDPGQGMLPCKHAGT